MNLRRSNKSLAALCVVPMTALWLASSPAQAQTAQPTARGASMPHGSAKMDAAGSHDLKASMMMGMESMQKMPTSGDMDRDFAMMMKMHHQQAVDMAQMELAHGKSPEMKAMARQIIAAQKKEIAEFDRWLARKK